MTVLKIWNTTSERSYPVAADEITDALIILNNGHAHIHEGESWHVFDDTANIGAEAGDFIDIQWTTPAASVGLMHCLFNGYCAAAFTFDLREAQTGGGAGGGALTARNRRRDNTDTPISFLKDDGIGTGGTVLFSQQLGAGVSAFNVGGAIRGSAEWILKAATLYQLRVYNAGANAATISIDYYVHADKHAN